MLRTQEKDRGQTIHFSKKRNHVLAGNDVRCEFCVEKLTMKKSIFAKTLLITSIACTSISANAAEQDPLTTWEKAGVFSSTIIVGTIAGGPIGLVLGIAAGDWINNTWDKSIESEQLTAENQQATENLLASELQNNQLLHDVLILDQQLQQVSETEELNQQLILDALQLDLLFAVNQSAIDTTNQARLTQLSDYLIDIA